MLTPASLLYLKFLCRNFVLEFHMKEYESLFEDISQINRK